jgi:hypothetical protein
MLAAGLKGVEEEYPVPPPLEGNVFAMSSEERQARGIKTLPGSLGEAIVLAENSELVREALGDHVFFLEIADTAEERARGLMERASLPLDQAMLFVFETEAPWAFWMKNTLIPLDIIWMSSTLEVVDIQTMHPEPGKTDAELTRYTPRGAARYVLEMNAGQAQAYQLSRGMKVTLHLAEE